MTKIYNIYKFKKTRKDLRKKSTIHEIILWSKLKNKQLRYKFRRQYSINNFIVDSLSKVKILLLTE